MVVRTGLRGVPVFFWLGSPLVEDKELNREFLKGHMIQCGIEVEETGDAESTIEIIDAAGPFDFVVFNIYLQVMKGGAGELLAQPASVI